MNGELGQTEVYQWVGELRTAADEPQITHMPRWASRDASRVAQLDCLGPEHMDAIGDEGIAYDYVGHNIK